MTENLYTPGRIRTFSGIYIDPLNPHPGEIALVDIAHALSHQPRFGGHLPSFYSVASHSIDVSLRVNNENALAALMHDAAEAYLIDVPRPVKQRLTGYREIEDNLMRIIAAKFGFEYPLNEAVKSADEEALRAEWHTLMLGKMAGVFSEQPKIVRSALLKRYAEIKGLENFNIVVHGEEMIMV